MENFFYKFNRIASFGGYYISDIIFRILLYKLKS
jgi:hypothetical protein